MRVIEYAVEYSEDVLSLKRTRKWLLWSYVASLFPVAGIVMMSREYILHPVDKFTLILSCLIVCGMMFVFYKLLIWGRLIVFDKNKNQFSIDNRSICALSDLTWVQIEGSQRSKVYTKMGRLRVLHLKTAEGRDISLKTAWEGSPEYSSMIELVRVISEFTGAKNNVD